MAQVSQKDTASITRMLDLLQKKGLIQRVDDLYDRRKYMISLTHEGLEFVLRHLPFVNMIRRQIINGLSTEDIQALKRILDTIQKNTE